MSRAALLVVLGACWTGAEPQVATTPVEEVSPPPRGPGLRVRLERTDCLATRDGPYPRVFGGRRINRLHCPTYTVVILPDGRVRWDGRANVIATGVRQGRVSRADLAKLSEHIDAAQFFERDNYGELPAKSPCTTTNGVTTCSFSGSICTDGDAPQAIISITRNGRTHRVDHYRCNEQPGLDELEAYIDAIAHTQAWVGP